MKEAIDTLLAKLEQQGPSKTRAASATDLNRAKEAIP